MKPLRGKAAWLPVVDGALLLLAAWRFQGCSASTSNFGSCLEDASLPLKHCLERVVLAHSRGGPPSMEDAQDPEVGSVLDDVVWSVGVGIKRAIATYPAETSLSPVELERWIWDDLGLPPALLDDSTRQEGDVATGSSNLRGGEMFYAGEGGEMTGETNLLPGDGVRDGASPPFARKLGEADFLELEGTWANILLTGVCVVCAGLAAGLTMGLVSIEPLEMEIKQRSGTPEERLQASRILPLVTRHHFLLVTLLLFNSLANEALPIFLGNLVPAWLAIILSVSLVLFFGEILPSAIFTGKGQLAIASSLAWLVYMLMFLFSPIAWPLSWILDQLLGIEGFKRYSRAEIAALVQVQQELSAHDMTNLAMHPDEVAIVKGVLQTAQKGVSEAMVPMDKVFCLSRQERLNSSTMADIMASGYSRVLVYDGTDTSNIRGYLQVKKLIMLNPDDERDIRTLALWTPVVVSPNKSLLELLNTFQTGHSHLALVSHSPAVTLESLKSGARLEGAARPIGIITLEDIIEEIIQEEIMDETDRMNENRARETLRRFARMALLKERKQFGRHAALGMTNPAADANQKLQANGVSPSLGLSPSLALSVSGRSYDSGNEPPVAPGVNERSRLLGRSNSNRHGAKGQRSGTKRVAGSQEGRGPVDPNPTNGQDSNSPLLANDLLSTYGSAAAEPGPGESSVNASGES